VLRWAAVGTVVAWKACTKKLAAVSFQLDQRPRLRERGFFCLGKALRWGQPPPGCPAEQGSAVGFGKGTTSVVPTERRFTRL
jgi:hypothetical protein